MTTERCNMDPAMRISRLKGKEEILSWEYNKQGREWKKMRIATRQKPEIIVPERWVLFLLIQKEILSSEISIPFLTTPSTIRFSSFTTSHSILLFFSPTTSLRLQLSFYYKEMGCEQILVPLPKDNRPCISAGHNHREDPLRCPAYRDKQKWELSTSKHSKLNPSKQFTKMFTWS